MLGCSFEACSRKGHLRQDDFALIVAALKAGQPHSAQGAWEAIQARKEQDSGRRNIFPKRRARKAVPIKPSLSPAPDADAPGSSLSSREVFLPGRRGLQAVCHATRTLILGNMAMIHLKYKCAPCLQCFQPHTIIH